MESNKVLIKAATAAARSIMAATEALGRAEVAVASTTTAAILKLVDEIDVAGIARDEAGVKMVKKAISTGFREVMGLAAELAAMSNQRTLAEGSIGVYINRAVKMWYYSNGKDKKITAARNPGKDQKAYIPQAYVDKLATPFSRGGGRPAAKKASPVESTSREDLDKAIADAIRIAKALGLGGFAASIEDLVKASLSK